MPDVIGPEPLTGPDLLARQAVLDRASRVLRPPGALARLDEVAAWLGSWQRTDTPAIHHPMLLVAAGDHGVARRGVSAFDPLVTKAMVDAIRAGVATSSVMAASVGAGLRLVDAGVGAPTGDITVEPALDADRFEELWALGRDTVADMTVDLLVLGEMGIGNTTAASAVSSTLCGGPVENWVGPGTGIDPETWDRKTEAVERARARATGADPIEVLRLVGGSEMVVLAGACHEARLRSIPVILDGFVVTAAVAPLAFERPNFLDHCLAGHRSPEPGHGRLLDRLGLRPLLDVEMRLGEGTGALAALPLLKLAAAAVVDVATFEEWGLR
ncbi:MAG: nicotinate-nucleotide--dimethylbenzimidazole phosphoribosyltransferase [Acidimicrobiia bacterium]|nr:nicotinate-nucleotide--dimethylbenzimidazole phosphoribosyltransferase [Acidimicrobiia bacterium]MDH4309120.1 nicotinate-nucleotide--dimethylbenzimidazole phosphoribosyltransferase [Acidimicrobiia bacterium]